MMQKIQTVAQIGLGALSAFTAPGLQHLLGDRFAVVASGERAQRIRRHGMEVNGVHHDFHVVSPQDASPVDLVILTVKYPQLKEALSDIAPFVGEHTILLPLLNGVESEEACAQVYGWEKVLYGLCQVSIVMKDGHASYNPKAAVLRFGERENHQLSPRVQAVRTLLEQAGIPCEVPQDMLRAQWLKFMYNISQNQSSAVLGIPFGAWQVSEDANIIREMGMREVIAVAQAMGIALGEEDIASHREYLKKVPYANKTSMLQDIEAGRPTEVDQLAGTLVRLGEAYGVPTPLNRFYYHAIRVLEEKNAGKI